MDLLKTQDILTRSLEKKCPAEVMQQVRAMLKTAPRMTRDIAIEIYRNNHTGALARALATTFPACRRILGDDCFNGIARKYIGTSPSRQSDLNRYGDAFPDHLGAWTKDKTVFADFGYLRDLARLEWFWHAAYYQQDDDPFDFAAFAKASQSRLSRIRLRVSHSLGLLKSEYPVLEIWNINREGGEADEVQAEELPQHLVIHRREGHPRIETVSADTHALLQHCRNGKRLVELYVQANIGEERIAELLPELVRKAWITGFEVASDS